MSNNKTSLQASQVKKQYQMGEMTVDALQGVDFSVRSGEFVAIMGPSGSGKSTLLHLLAGLDIPTEGLIEVGDQPFLQLSDKDLTLLRRRKIGVVFQFFSLLPSLTALENITLPLLLDGQPMHQCRARAEQVLAWVGLEDRASHTPDRLSGGEQQRTALARAMIFQPDILLADEPTGNLDRNSGERVLQLLRRAVDELGQTIVMVTHDPWGASFADRVVFLSDGRVIHELKGEHVNHEGIISTQASLGAD